MRLLRELGRFPPRFELRLRWGLGFECDFEPVNGGGVSNPWYCSGFRNGFTSESTLRAQLELSLPSWEGKDTTIFGSVVVHSTTGLHFIGAAAVL